MRPEGVMRRDGAVHRQLALVAAAGAALGVVLLLAMRLVGGPPPARVAVGAPAPGFTATTLDAVPATRTLDDYRGRVTLVNVWATWCAPCRVEMPSLARLHRRFAAEGLAVAAIAVDEVGFEGRIRDYAASLGLGFDILHDPSGRTERDWNAEGLPSSYVLDRRGIVRRIVRGADEWDSEANIALVRGLLAERP